ncbi:uncharacterized protein LOC144133451 [Amblyomma americanum]
MEREILFGDHLRLPSGSKTSSCELELLRLLRDVDLAVLEKHQRWKAKLGEAEDVLAKRDAELKQTKHELASCREEVSQLRDHVAYLEAFQADLVSKYDRRIAELKEDVSRIKKRYGDLKAAAGGGHDGRATSTSADDAVDFWKNRVAELEREVARLRRREVATDREVRSAASKQREELERLVSDKDGVIDRLTDKIAELTKRLRQVESAAATSTKTAAPSAPVVTPAGGLRMNWDPPDLVEQYLGTFQDDKMLKNATELRNKIEQHMHEFTAKIEQDKRTL